MQLVNERVTMKLLRQNIAVLGHIIHVGQKKSVTSRAYLKKVWCSMQTFHNRFEARWLGSLKPMVLSNCSYLSVGEEWRQWRERGGEVKNKSAGSKCRERWWNGDRVNCVYAAVKSIVFSSVYR